MRGRTWHRLCRSLVTPPTSGSSTSRQRTWHHRVLAALPASVDLVALHSNPGPVHTFVQPDTLDFVGMIDFGDAYISHPALDWRWPTHADRVALLQGYCDETPVTDEFMAAWRAALVLSDMAALATRPETQAPGTGAVARPAHDLCVSPTPLVTPHATTHREGPSVDAVTISGRCARTSGRWRGSSCSAPLPVSS